MQHHPLVADKFGWLVYRQEGWQLGEQGVFAEVCRTLGITRVIECGGGDPEKHALAAGLCANVNTVVVEADEELARAWRSKGYAVINRFVDHGTPLAGLVEKQDNTAFVVDIDSDDLWQAVKVVDEHEPLAIMVEHHDECDPDNPKSSALVPHPSLIGKPNSGGFYWQANLRAVLETMKEYGYTLVWASRYNGLYVRNDVADNLTAVGHGFNFAPLPEKPKIALVKSEPRITFTEHARRWMAICANIPNIHDCSLGSAFWDQGMEMGAEAALRINPDVILFADYDSVFTVDDVQELMRIMSSDPKAAVVYAVQMHRHGDEPLVHEPDLDYSGETTAKKFAHFGLTIVRPDVFRKLPKPWFWSVPGPDGKWSSDARSDADITFWRILAEHGMKVLQANKVIAGHLEVCAKYPAKKGVLWQPVQNMRQNPKPAQVEFDGNYWSERIKRGRGV